MSYMGLDIGTTGCKAIVFNEDGNELSLSYREYKTHTPKKGWAELDPNEVTDKCFEVIKEASSLCTKNPVVCMGISSQGEAFTTIDSNGKVLSNAMVSFDARASLISESFSKKFGKEKLYNITGQTAHPMYSLFKLLWLKENEPDIWKNADKFLCFEDLIQYRLGLKPAISWSLAGRTMIFDVRKHAWDEEILDAVGIKRYQLANPMPSGSIIGKIPKDNARLLGFKEDVFVATAGHDQPCGGLGAGVVSEGMAMYSTGTTECVTPAFNKPIFSNELFKSNLCTYDHTVKDMYTTAAFNLTGGNLLKWFRDVWGEKELQEAKRSGKDPYEIILRDMEKRPTNIFVLPYFTTTGTPYFDANVPGAIFGLRLTTKRCEVLRALLEGLSFEMRLNFDILERSGIKTEDIRVIGGGAKSSIWNQLKADILNKPITTVAVTEAASFGAAMLACSAITKEPIKKITKSLVKSGPIVEPNKENAEYYNERFKNYKKLYPTLKTLI